MSKHPLDHDRGPSTARLAKFLQVERAQRPSDASKALQRRERPKGPAIVKAFARIERGHSA